MRSNISRVLLLALPTLAGCGEGATGEAVDGGSDADTPIEAVQPLGLLVAAGEAEGVRLTFYSTGAPPQAVMLADIPLDHPARAIRPARLAPFQPFEVVGGGLLSDPAAAVAVVFTAPGALPVAVPAIDVREDRLAAAAPALVTAEGVPYAGPVEVRVVQARGTERLASPPLADVELLDLPGFSPGLPPGEATAAYLSAGLQQLDALTRRADLPADFVARATTLRDDLGALAIAVDLARTSGSALLPWLGNDPGVLDGETLALTDRLVFALLRAGFPGTLKTGRIQTGLSECAAYEGAPEQQMKSLLCQRSNYGETLTTRGSAGIIWGAQVEMAVFTGMYGGAGSAVLSTAVSRRAALAFETVWAALSGHIAAFATAAKPPTAVATLRDAGAQLVDRLTRSGGALATLTSMMAFTAEYDRLLQQTTRPPRPDGGVPNDAGPTDAGPTDAGPTDAGLGPYPPVLEGIFEAGQDWPDECAVHLELVLVLTVENLAGGGTPDDPFRGHPTAVGSLSGGPTIPGPDCEGNATFPLSALQGSLGGVGEVVIEGELLGDGFALPLEFRGVYANRTLRGSMAVYMPNPQLAPFTGEVVLTEP